MHLRFLSLIAALVLLSSSKAQVHNVRKAEDSSRILIKHQEGNGQMDDAPGPVYGKDSNVYDSVDVKAMFPGGSNAFIQYVQANFQYPVRCQEEGISGYVLLRFMVDLRGKIYNVSILKETTACPEFTQEAIRLIKYSPPWIPAQIKGRFVSSWLTVPIRLQMN